MIYSPKMNKDAKSLRQLAVPLVLFALCVAVQQSDSAVSARPSSYILATFNGFTSTRYQHEKPVRDSPGAGTTPAIPANPNKVYK